MSPAAGTWWCLSTAETQLHGNGIVPHFLQGFDSVNNLITLTPPSLILRC